MKDKHRLIIMNKCFQCENLTNNHELEIEFEKCLYWKEEIKAIDINKIKRCKHN